MRVIICEQCEGAECGARDWCMCGDRMDHHDMYCGHSPVSMHDYLGTEHRVLSWYPFMWAMTAVTFASCVAVWILPSGPDRTAAFFVNVVSAALQMLGALNHVREQREW